MKLSSKAWNYLRIARVQFTLSLNRRVNTKCDLVLFPDISALPCFQNFREGKLRSPGEGFPPETCLEYTLQISNERLRSNVCSSLEDGER